MPDSPPADKPETDLPTSRGAIAPAAPQTEAQSTISNQQSAIRVDWRSLVFDVLLAIVLIAGAYLRAVGLDWDSGQHLHPDERFLTMVENGISPVKDIAEYFDTAVSSLNPYNRGYGFFVYGTLPIFITRYAAEWVGQTGYDQVHLVGRALSTVTDLLAVFLVYLIGTRLYDRRVGLLAAALSAFTVVDIQQSHFFTVDTFANLFVAAAIYFAVRVLERRDETWERVAPAMTPIAHTVRSYANYALFGLFFGMAVASKINTFPLAMVIALAGFTVAARVYRSGAGEVAKLEITRQVVIGLALAAIVSAIAFRVGQPYAFAGPSPFSIKLNDQWLTNMGEIREQVSGNVDFPPGHQWTNRPAYIFPLDNMIKWGMGVPLGLAVWFGFAWALWQCLRGKWQRHLIPVAWSGAYFAWQGMQWVKPLRYFMPIYPTLIILGAWALIELLDAARGKRKPYAPFASELDRVDAAARWVRDRFPLKTPSVLKTVGVSMLIAIVVIGAGAWAFAFSRIYTRPVTRLAASEWMQQNIPGPLNAQIETADGIFSQPVSMPYDHIYMPGVPNAAPFVAMRGGTVQSILIGHLGDPFHDSENETFSVKLAADVLGESTLATATLTADLSKTDDPRGASYTLTLDKPAAITKGVQYWLIAEATESAPISIAGSTIANESSWDDGLPLRFDGFDPYGGIYRGENLELYWDDNEQKRELILGVLDRSDYIAISSNRQYASIPRLPMRYPLTIRYYDALFSGELGFELAYVNESAPNLGPIVISDQSAEEPFTVYDHPKVLIFKKSASYSGEKARAILEAVDLSKVVWMNPRQATAAPTVLMLPPDRLVDQRAGGTWSQMFDPNGLLNKYEPLGVIVWWITAVLLGWLVFPITFAALRGLPDRGYALTRNVSLLLIAWASWILASLRLLPFAQWSLWLITLTLMLISTVVVWRRDEIKAWVSDNRLYMIRVEAFALALFIFFLLIRWGNADLWHPSYGGEKPMDFSYFNAVLKSTSFPPYDPWFAGGYLNYYYFGFVIVGVLTKMLGIVPSFAYNLILPMLFSLAGTGAFGVAFNLVAKKESGVRSQESEGGSNPTSDLRPPTSIPSPYIAGIAAALLFVALGNLGELDVLVKALTRAAADIQTFSAIPFFADLQRMAVGLWRVYVEGIPAPIGTGEWYWNATRVIPDQQTIPITEFPFFTFLYADLHAHMIVLSVAVVALGWCVSAVLVETPRRGVSTEAVAMWMIGGIAFGAIRPSNLSDYQTYWLLGCVAILYAEYRKHGKIGLPFLIGIGWRCALLVGLAVALFQPYSAWRGEGYGSIELWTGDKTPLNPYLTIHGLFLFIIVAFLLVETRRWMQQTTVEEIKDWLGMALIALIALLALVIELWLLGYTIAIVAVPLIAWTGLLIIRGGAEPERRSALALIGLGLLLTFVVEVVVAKGDIGRMNTVFKFYLQVWTFFSVAGGAALAWVWAHTAEWHPFNRRVWKFALGLLVASAASYTLFAASAKVSDRMAPSAPRTLDGMTYMKYAEYGDQGRMIDLKWDYDAIRWMQDHVVGSPVIVEVNAVEYRWGSRYTIYTGLPGVVGWNWHQRQQRVVVPPSLITDRVEAVNEFYASPDESAAMEFLKKYDVSYVVVGSYERAYFPPLSLDKFETMASEGLLKVAYRNEGTVIYEVVR